MTLKEYEEIVWDSINKSTEIAEVKEIINNVEDVLNKISLDTTEIQKFWVSVYSKLEYNIREINHDQIHKAVAQAQAEIAAILASGKLKWTGEVFLIICCLL